MGIATILVITATILSVVAIIIIGIVQAHKAKQFDSQMGIGNTYGTIDNRQPGLGVNQSPGNYRGCNGQQYIPNNMMCQQGYNQQGYDYGGQPPMEYNQQGYDYGGQPEYQQPMYQQPMYQQLDMSQQPYYTQPEPQHNEAADYNVDINLQKSEDYYKSDYLSTLDSKYNFIDFTNQQAE